jgi:hypothetical protein
MDRVFSGNIFILAISISPLLLYLWTRSAEVRLNSVVSINNADVLKERSVCPTFTGEDVYNSTNTSTILPLPPSPASTASPVIYQSISPAPSPSPSSTSMPPDIFEGLSYFVRPSISVPLRRHAIILTGSIRTLVDAFPTFLDLFNATTGGFDVYAVLSTTKGGFRDEDQGFERDYKSLMWLKDFSTSDSRITLQLLAFDDHTPESAYSTDVLRDFPSAESYPWSYPNGRAELLNIWKQSRAQKVLEDHCVSMSRKMMSSYGRECYDMVVRARPDLFFYFEKLERLRCKHLGPSFDEVRQFSQTFYSNRINLDVYWNAWNRSQRLSTTLPTNLLTTILRVDTWISGPSDGPACVNSAAVPAESAFAYDYLPLFSPAHGNDWGGPNDSILWGPFETMRHYFSRGSTLEKGLFKRISFHPETLVKCGIMESVRTSQLHLNSDKVMRHVAIEHIMLSLGYCRQKNNALTHCVAVNDLPNVRRRRILLEENDED